MVSRFSFWYAFSKIDAHFILYKRKTFPHLDDSKGRGVTMLVGGLALNHAIVFPPCHLCTKKMTWTLHFYLRDEILGCYFANLRVDLAWKGHKLQNSWFTNRPESNLSLLRRSKCDSEYASIRKISWNECSRIPPEFSMQIDEKTFTKLFWSRSMVYALFSRRKWPTCTDLLRLAPKKLFRIYAQSWLL